MMAVDIPTLETNRLILRAPRADDLYGSAAMWGDESVVRYISGKPSSRSESWARLLRQMGHWQAMGYGTWTIEDKESGSFVGEIGLANFLREIEPPANVAPEIGWVLAPEFHGRGLATEAAVIGLGWADQHIDASKTFCTFDPENKASLRVAEKLGYGLPRHVRFMDLPTLILERNRPCA